MKFRHDEVSGDAVNARCPPGEILDIRIEERMFGTTQGVTHGFSPKRNGRDPASYCLLRESLLYNNLFASVHSVQEYFTIEFTRHPPFPHVLTRGDGLAQMKPSN